MELDTPAKGFRNVQVDDPENVAVLTIDNQNLGDDSVAYFGFLVVIACFVLVGLFGPPTSTTSVQEIPRGSTNRHAFNTTIKGLTPLSHQLIVSVTGTEWYEEAWAHCSFVTKDRNVSKVLPLNVDSVRVTGVFYSRVLNFTEINIDCWWKGSGQALRLKTEIETATFVTTRIWTIICLTLFWTGLIAFRLLMPHKIMREVQWQTVFLIVMTIMYDNPLMAFYFKSPWEGMLTVDLIMKQFYFAYLMYYGIVVFRHVEMPHKVSVFEKAAPYFGSVYAVAGFAAALVSPPRGTVYGDLKPQITWIDVVMGVVIVFYVLVFVANAFIAHKHMEASGSYAFRSYCVIAIVYALLLGFGQAMKLFIRELSVQFTFSVATVNVFALAMDRAHSEASESEFFYENADSASEGAGGLEIDINSDPDLFDDDEEA